MVSFICSLNIMHHALYLSATYMSTWCDYYCARVVYILLCGDDVGILYDMIVLIIDWWLIYDSTTVIITQPIIISCSGILPRRTIISIL